MKGGTPYLERAQPWGRRCQWLCGILVGVLLGCRPSVTPPEVLMDHLDTELANSVRVARAAVIATPQSGSTWGHLGQVFQAAGYPAEACLSYQQATRIDPGSLRWWHLLGGLQLVDQPEAGLASLARAVTLSGSTNSASRLALARALVERGRLTEAILPLQILLASEPAHPAARLEMARIRLAENDTAAVLSLLAPCLTNPFTIRSAWLLAAQAQGRAGNPAAAAAAARQAARQPSGPGWPDPFLREIHELRVGRQNLADQVGQYLAQQRLSEAEARLQQLLAHDPEDREGLLLLGRLRLQQGRFQEAEQQFQRLRVLQPNSLNVIVQLGLAFYGQSRWSESAAAFEEAVRIKPDFAQGHYNLGLARAREGSARAAIQAFEASLRCQPGDGAVHVALAEELLLVAAVESARDHLRQAEELDPNSAKVRAVQARLPAATGSGSAPAR